MAGKQDILDFEAHEPATGEAVLVVDLGGYEGPLDLLLEMARRQKVDLAEISILALADQYLAFIAEARALRLELAGDYLVMAAWLAYLKSRLLLPGERKPDEPEAAELAADLAERLARLEVMRKAAKLLAERERFGIDVFGRGAPEPVVVRRDPVWQVSLHDFLTAYLERRVHQARAHVTVARRTVWSLQEAREALERLLGRALDWAPLDAFLSGFMLDAQGRRTARASAFAASLELVREGALELRQDRPFAPLMMRRRAKAAGEAA